MLPIREDDDEDPCRRERLLLRQGLLVAYLAISWSVHHRSRRLEASRLVDLRRRLRVEVGDHVRHGDESGGRDRVGDVDANGVVDVGRDAVDIEPCEQDAVLHRAAVVELGPGQDDVRDPVGLLQVHPAGGPAEPDLEVDGEDGGSGEVTAEEKERHLTTGSPRFDDRDTIRGGEVETTRSDGGPHDDHLSEVVALEHGSLVGRGLGWNGSDADQPASLLDLS
jgi:hypothetical protein